jgi:hypothetical protein
MQVISRFTREELENKNDPLDLSCHAINRLRFVGTTILDNTSGLEAEPLEGYSGEDVHTMGEIISDSTDELEKLIDISQKKNRELLRENRLLKGKLEAMEAEVTS